MNQECVENLCYCCLKTFADGDRVNADMLRFYALLNRGLSMLRICRVAVSIGVRNLVNVQEKGALPAVCQGINQNVCSHLQCFLA